ncbi:MAG: DNA-binding protein WhiA [Candidatus Eremiobacteraeota bacterium]|nr:DNA-binding protein WhiA [Candidatus Eremiobacteraeota bacterium]
MPSSLSADTKDALARDIPEAQHCRVALLQGLAYYCLPGKKDTFRTQRPAVARLFWSLLEKHEDANIQRVSGTRLYKIPTYEIDLPPGWRSVARRSVWKCDRKMEVRGAFLTGGSLSSTAHGYHLEFTTGSGDRADRLASILASLGHMPKLMVRKNTHVLYYKSFDAIADVLSSVGAFAAVLHIQEIRARKETKNRIHRLVNSEAANVDRAAVAGAIQRGLITYLLGAHRLRHLPPPLREIAELRLAHPEETLSQLGKRCSPPVVKSTVNSRIGRLMRLAKHVQSGPLKRAHRRESGKE